MDAAQLWLFFVVVFGVIALPGLDMAFVLASSLSGGKRDGVAAVAGIVAGGACHVLMGALGIAAILALWPALFNAVLLAGALYIGWIGWSLLRSQEAFTLPAAGAARRGGPVFVQGMLTCLLNPKAYVFMLAIFPQFLRPEAGSIWLQAGALGMITVVTQTAVYGVVAVAAVRARGWFDSNPRANLAAARSVGVVLLFAAVLTATQGWQAQAATVTKEGKTMLPQSHQVYELRQYTMYAGKRDTLISLFEDKFIEGQEDTGMRVTGLFTEPRNPDRFVWLRSFADMKARHQALNDFYHGPLWQANRDAANATLADNDNVLLLRPASNGSGFAVDPRTRPARAARLQPGFVTATIYYFANEPDVQFISRFERELMPVLVENGARIVGHFVSEKSKNTFGRLPVRESDNVFVWFASFASEAAYERHQRALQSDSRWRDRIAPYLEDATIRDPEILLLTPTARSLIR